MPAKMTPGTTRMKLATGPGNSRRGGSAEPSAAIAEVAAASGHDPYSHVANGTWDWEPTKSRYVFTVLRRVRLHTNECYHT